MPFEESIFTEDIEALDEDFEAFDEADEAFDEDFSEAYNDRKKKGGAYRGPAGSSGVGTRNSFRAIGRQNAQQTVNTPAGKMSLPGVATKKDLSKLVDGVSTDFKKNSTAIQTINKSLANADKNLSAKNSDMEKKLKGLQLAQLASLVIAPKLTEIKGKVGPIGADGEAVITVSATKSNLVFPLIATLAISMLTSSPKVSGKNSMLITLGIVGAIVAFQDSKGGFDVSTILKDPIFLVVGVVILLVATDSKILG